MVKRAVIAVTLLAAVVACSNNAKSNAGASAQPGTANAAATPNCNGQSPVWAIAGPKVYLLPDDPHYGKTKHASYMCLSDAQAQGYRHGRGYGRRQHRRHHDAVNPNPLSP